MVYLPAVNLGLYMDSNINRTRYPLPGDKLVILELLDITHLTWHTAPRHASRHAHQHPR